MVQSESAESACTGLESTKCTGDWFAEASDDRRTRLISYNAPSMSGCMNPNYGMHLLCLTVTVKTEQATLCVDFVFQEATFEQCATDFNSPNKSERTAGSVASIRADPSSLPEPPPGCTPTTGTTLLVFVGRSRHTGNETYDRRTTVQKPSV